VVDLTFGECLKLLIHNHSFDNWQVLLGERISGVSKKLRRTKLGVGMKARPNI
jgi:hypothetical protein